MARVPVDQGSRFGKDRGLAGGEQRRQGAGVERLAGLGMRVVRAAGVDREMRTPGVEAEKDQRRAVCDPVAPRCGRLPIEKR